MKETYQFLVTRSCFSAGFLTETIVLWLPVALIARNSISSSCGLTTPQGSLHPFILHRWQRDRKRIKNTSWSFFFNTINCQQTRIKKQCFIQSRAFVYLVDSRVDSPQTTWLELAQTGVFGAWPLHSDRYILRTRKQDTSTGWKPIVCRPCGHKVYK